MQSLYTAATGMLAQQMNIDTISNNLANVSTQGFKKQRVEFQDLLYMNVKPAGTPSTRESTVPVGIQIGEGTKPVATQRIFTQGSISNTGNSLDLLIEGSDGFFKVVRADGEVVYTRDGAFKKDGDGNIVNSDGYMLDPQVQIPEDALSIEIPSDGRILVNLVGQEEAVEIGQIELARFVNPAGLEAMGHNVYRPTAASGEAIEGTPSSQGFASVAQGSLELSNVDVVDEMVNLIVAQRAYEINSRAVQTADDMMSAVVSLKQ